MWSCADIHDSGRRTARVAEHVQVVELSGDESEDEEDIGDREDGDLLAGFPDDTEVRVVSTLRIRVVVKRGPCRTSILCTHACLHWVLSV